MVSIPKNNFGMNPLFDYMQIEIHLSALTIIA